jgi:diacylglycerol kinase
MKNYYYQPVNWFKSMKYALRGLKMIIKNERNFRIQLIMGMLFVILGLVFHFEHSEWIATCFFVTLVLISEAFNSVIEAICDCISLEYRDTIKYAKDVSAGAVLLSSIAAVFGGVVIMYPHLLPIAQQVLQSISGGY